MESGNGEEGRGAPGREVFIDDNQSVGFPKRHDLDPMDRQDRRDVADSRVHMAQRDGYHGAIIIVGN